VQPAQVNQSRPQELHRTPRLRGAVVSGRTHRQPLAPPRTFSQLVRQANPHTECIAQVSSPRRPTSNDLRDQEMSEPSKSPASLKSETQPEAEQPTIKGLTPNAKLHFGTLRLTGAQAQTPKANANPFTNANLFTSLGEGNKETERHGRPHVEATEGWSFQGKRGHTLKLASPRLDATQLPFHTP
jgi:hypothetical protein